MKLIDKFLFFYSVIFVGVLTAGAVLSGFAWNKFIITLLFLPVTFYLMFQVIRYLYRLKYGLTSKPTTNPSTSKPLTQPLHLSHIFHQKSPLFLLTIGLFALILSATIAKSILTFSSPPMSPLSSTTTASQP